MQKILTRSYADWDAATSNLTGVASLIAEDPGPELRLAWQILESLFSHPDPSGLALSLVRPADGHGSSAHAVGEYEECAAVPAGRVCFVNSLLRLDADCGSWVWRVLRYRDDDCDTWEMAWPD